jgi:hypothetical protein
MHNENCPQHPGYLGWIGQRAPAGIIDLGLWKCICGAPPDYTDLVVADLVARQLLGRLSFEPRDALHAAYEDALQRCLTLRQQIEEKK